VNPTLIDVWLPEYLVSVSYSILVHASPERTAAALAQADFTTLPLVRGLMGLRGYRMGKNSPEQLGSATPALAVLGQARRFGSFLELASAPPREFLVGIAGRFWRPDGGMVRGLTPETFRCFERDGYAKAVWNFSLSTTDGGTLLSTETRVQTFGRGATVKFRLYWLLVGPFSGLIRKAMLREVKHIAEQM